MKAVLGFLFTVVLLAVGVVFGFGLAISQDHTVTRWARVNAPIDSVWRAISTPNEFPSWRADVTEVEVLPAVEGRPSWREVASGEALTFEVTRWSRPNDLVTRIADEGLPFGGVWVYRLERSGSETRVTITENGQIYSPVYRFVSQFILGYEGSLERYLGALVDRFGGAMDTDIEGVS